MEKWLSRQEHVLCSPEELSLKPQHPHKAIQTWLKMSVNPPLVGQTHKVPESLGSYLTERSRFQSTERPCLGQQGREQQKTSPCHALSSASYSLHTNPNNKDNSNIKEYKENWFLSPGCKPMPSQCKARKQQWGAIWFLLQLYLLHQDNWPARSADIISAFQDLSQNFIKYPMHPRRSWIDFSGRQKKLGSQFQLRQKETQLLFGLRTQFEEKKKSDSLPSEFL